MKKRCVYIAVPTTDGMVTVQVAHLLATAERLSLDPNCPFKFSWDYFCGYKPVDHMRNTIFDRFLKLGYERLWMIDADILAPTRAFAMLEVQAPIVGAQILGYTKPQDGEGIVLSVYAFDMKDGQAHPKMPTDQGSIVDAVGGGAMVIDRAVLEDPLMHLGEGDDGTLAIWRVQTDDAGKIRLTGDVDFCQRAAAAGYTGYEFVAHPVGGSFAEKFRDLDTLHCEDRSQ